MQRQQLRELLAKQTLQRQKQKEEKERMTRGDQPLRHWGPEEGNAPPRFPFGEAGEPRAPPPGYPGAPPQMPRGPADRWPYPGQVRPGQ